MQHEIYQSILKCVTFYTDNMHFVIKYQMYLENQSYLVLYCRTLNNQKDQYLEVLLPFLPSFISFTIYTLSFYSNFTSCIEAGNKT